MFRALDIFLDDGTAEDKSKVFIYMKHFIKSSQSQMALPALGLLPKSKREVIDLS